MLVIIVQTSRGAGHCPGPVVGGLRGGSSPSGDIFVAGQNIIILVAVHAAVPMQDSCVHNRMHLGRGRSQEEVLAELNPGTRVPCLRK
jgi:hypothetical protein